MDTKHIQEPWKIDTIRGSNDDGWEVYLIPETGPESDWHRKIAKANAARIVACVNALAGIENPAEYIAAFRAATLKEAADRAEAWYRSGQIIPAHTNSLAIRELRAAIEGDKA